MKLVKIVEELLNGILLSRYEDSDFIIKQKVKAIATIAITVCLVIVTVLYPYFFFYRSAPAVILPPTIVLIICIVILLSIRKGHFSFAGHLLVIVIFIAAWISLFIDTNRLLMKLDTIAYVLGTFTLLTLIDIKRRQVIFLYFLLNVIALVFLLNDVLASYSVDIELLLEYALDNGIVLVFISVVVYMSVIINQNALKKARESIDIAQAETLKNQMLAQSLEMQVSHRTQQLVKNNEELQKEVNERLASEKRLKETQEQLIMAAHKAGMAEIATDTLHNVGNILNSLKTSAFIIKQNMTNNPLEYYIKACEYIQQNGNNLNDFLLNDPKAEKAIEYLLVMKNEFKATFNDIDTNLKRLNDKIEAIDDVIKAQQNYASALKFSEKVEVEKIVEDTLNFITELEKDTSIVITKNFSPIPPLVLQKNRLMHILLNLIKNAIHSLNAYPGEEKRLTIDIFIKEKILNIRVVDTGVGIEAENMTKIFASGYTTRQSGFGFGLHSCANYAAEMGGSITAESEGLNKGATFSVKIPVEPADC